MNIRAIRPFVAALAALPLLLSSVSCSDTDISSADPSQVDPASLPGVIRFSLPDINSRVSYDGLQSKFQPGDKVGCIILNYDQWNPGNSSYRAATSWEVNSRLFIELKKIKNAGAANWEIPNEYSAISPLYIHSGYESLGHEYLKLDQYSNYGFIFYYPFIENEDIQETLTRIVADYNRDNSTPFCDLVPFPNCATNTGAKFGAYGNGYGQEEYDVSNVDSGGVKGFAERRIFSAEISNITSEDNNCYGWTEYPVFVSVNQKNSLAHQYSDFMTATRFADDEGKIIASYNNTNATLEVRFHKRHSAVEVISDDPVTDLHFYYSDTDKETAWKPSDYTWGGFLVGRKYDLIAETFSEWFPDKAPTNLDGDRIGRNYIQRWPEELYPFEVRKNHHYRVILPPQPVPATEDAGFLRFTDSDGVAQSLPLSKIVRVASLEENKLYIIRLKKGFADIIIQDWVYDDSGVLEEISTSTD